MTNFDLHIHSNKSDGKLSPKEIIDMAAKHGVKVIAITDHDTVAAHTKQVHDYAEEKGVVLLTGIEISSENARGGFHILGYNIDVNNEFLKQGIKRLKENRMAILSESARKLGELGFKVDTEELKKLESIAKGSIAENVIDNPENKEALINKFGHIPGKGEFIQTYMNKGCPAHVKKDHITPAEAAEMIRRAGGKVVLAHPVVYIYEKNFSEEDVVNVINEIKPDGIEANYVCYDKLNNRHYEYDRWKAIANKFNMFATIGSDFHRDDGIRPLVGFVNENIALSSDDEQKIKDNLLTK